MLHPWPECWQAVGMCLQVLSASQAKKLAHMTDMHPSACTALCMEVRCQKAGETLPRALLAEPRMPEGPKASPPPARMLHLADIAISEVHVSPLRVSCIAWCRLLGIR